MLANVDTLCNPIKKIPTKNWAMDGAQYQVKVCGEHESNTGGPTGGSWDQICPPLDPLRTSGAPKEAFQGPKEPLLPVFSSWVVPTVAKWVPIWEPGSP